MRTEFFEGLKGQTLDDEMIKKIQAESGKDVTAEKTKMQAQIDSLTGQVNDLQSQVTQRDADYGSLKEQLEKAGQSATKLGEVQKQFDELSAKYEREAAEHKAQLDRQEYEFLVKESVSGVDFSCNAAKENFINKLLEKKLPVENKKLLGFDDYLTSAKEADPGAFKAKEDPQVPPPASFSNPTGAAGSQAGGQQPQSMFGFNFMGVRKHDN